MLFKLLVVFYAALWATTISAGVCWKSTYGRGVGTIPDTCKPHESKSGLLCYPDCKPGYYNVAGVCWQQCTSGFKDTGAHCLKPDSYGRGAGYPIWDKGRCENDNKPIIENRPAPCPGNPTDRFGNPINMTCGTKKVVVDARGCEQSGLLWYPRCRAGFHPVGCCVCSPNCPPGTTDIGVSCQKDSYVVPPITPNCGAKTYDAGLCYVRCNAGFYGVGPVCWGQCPKDRPVDCGAMCGTSAADCANAIGEMVLSVGQVIAKIAETIGTLGATTGIDAAAGVVKDTLISTMKSTVKKAVTGAVKVAGGAIVKDLQGKGVPPALAGKLASMTTNPDTFDYQGFLKGLDPTGIIKVVDAFNKQICPTPSGVAVPAGPGGGGVRPSISMPANLCSKIQSSPSYKALADHPPGGLGSWNRTEALAILNRAGRIALLSKKPLADYDVHRLLTMDCNRMRSDIGFAPAISTPPARWTANQRTAAIRVLTRGTQLELDQVSQLSNQEISDFLHQL